MATGMIPEDAFEVPQAEKGPKDCNDCGLNYCHCAQPPATAPMPSTGPDAAWPQPDVMLNLDPRAEEKDFAENPVEEAERAYKAINRKDNVRRPEHYARWKHEPIKFLIENEVNGTQFNVVKYVMRYQFKNGVEDLKKARRYLDMEIKRLEGDPKWSE